MTAQDLNKLTVASTTSSETEEEFSIPLDISDIILICQEFNKLGWQIQNQVETILELGIEESIKSGVVKYKSLPYIKSFLYVISKNPYFGDAASQAKECMNLISGYESLTLKTEYN